MPDAVEIDAALVKRDTVFPAIRRDAEERRRGYIAETTAAAAGVADTTQGGTGALQDFADPTQLRQSGLLHLDDGSGPNGLVRITSSAGRADDWLLSVGFSVPSVYHRLREHFNNLNASELTAGRTEVINRILAARTQGVIGAPGASDSAAERGVL